MVQATEGSNMPENTSVSTSSDSPTEEPRLIVAKAPKVKIDLKNNKLKEFVSSEQDDSVVSKRQPLHKVRIFFVHSFFFFDDDMT